MFPAQFFPFPEGLEIIEVIPPTDQNGTGTVQSAWINLNQYEGNVALCLHSALADAGTSPTLTITIQHREDSADTPAALPASSLHDGDGNNATFAVVTGAANGGLQTRALIRAETRAQIQVTATVGGTSTPSFVFGMFLVASNKYGAF